MSMILFRFSSWKHCIQGLGICYHSFKIGSVITKIIAYCLWDQLIASCDHRKLEAPPLGWWSSAVKWSHQSAGSRVLNVSTQCTQMDVSQCVLSQDHRCHGDLSDTTWTWCLCLDHDRWSEHRKLHLSCLMLDYSIESYDVKKCPPSPVSTLTPAPYVLGQATPFLITVLIEPMQANFSWNLDSCSCT